MDSTAARRRPQRDAPHTADRPGPARAGGPGRLSAWLELTKPGITRLVVATAAAAYYLASAGSIDWLGFIHTIVGIALVGSGANALNQFAERDADALMRRTAGRPLPTGRVSVPEALIFGTALAFIGLVHLFFLVNPLTAGIVLASLLSYLFVYTPLKRRTWHATLVGTVPGALPALAGWTAATGSISAGGLAVFAIVMVWQMPHFFALGWMYREDYERGGFRMLSRFDPSGSRTTRQMAAYTSVLLPVSLLPAAIGITSWWYAVGATVLGLAFLIVQLPMFADRARGKAHRVFLASIIYLPALLALMVIDRAI